MPETWDLGTPEGRRKAWEAGLLDGCEEKDRKGTFTGTPGKQRSAKRGKRDDLTPARQAFLAACAAHGLPEPVPEYVFAPPRKWRFDWLFDGWLAVEIQGGLFSGGRHVRGAALKREYEKLNAAAIAGYTILFLTPDGIEDGSAFDVVRRCLEVNP